MTAVLTASFKVSAILILFSLLLIASYPVWAQESTTGGTRRVEKRMVFEEKRETIKEKIATRQAQLKTKLQAFKDKKKAEITERISNNLNRINAQRTATLLKHLDKMTAILNKLEGRVNQGSPDIKNPALAKAAIAESRAKIASSQAAVKAQANKDYTPTVTSEGKVKADAQAQRDRLHQDLQAVRIQVIDAKQSVANAIRVAKSGKIEVPGKKEGTPSGQ